MKRSIQIAIGAALVIGVIAFREFREAPAGAAVTASSGRFVVPAGVADFRLGTLEFKACELAQRRSAATTAASCATLDVAENRADPQGRTISLGLALIRSTEPADDDFIVFLAGGPGQSAIESWPQVAAGLEPARKRRHVLLLDQRGTGRSNALACPDAPDDDALVEFDLELLRERTKACLDAVAGHADPRFYTTSEAVADLEALRQALGAPRLDLVGVSYGTRVAQQYYKRHPEGVRSIVLDSPVPNELVLGGEFAGNLDRALKAQFADCAADPACSKAFPDPYARLLALREDLRARPRVVGYPDPVTFERVERRLDGFGLAGLVRLYAYTPETAALIPLVVEQALAGNDAPLMGQVHLITDSLAELAGSGMQLSVVCAEDSDRLAADPADEDTLLGSLLVDVMRTQCAIWPRGERPTGFNDAVAGDVPVLVLAGELDPVTPPRYGEQIVKNLGNARLVVARGQGHSILGRGCLPKVVAGFLDTLQAATLDVSCSERFGPVPHFIDFNGAAP